MISDIYNEFIEKVAVDMANYIHQSHKTYSAIEMEEALKLRIERFNYSQIGVIVSRVIKILQIVNFLKTQKIKGRLNETALKKICKNHNYDLYTLKIAVNILFGKEETNIIAFIK